MMFALVYDTNTAVWSIRVYLFAVGTEDQPEIVE